MFEIFFGPFLGRVFFLGQGNFLSHLQAPLPNLTKYPCKETRKRPIDLRSQPPSSVAKG